MLRPLRRSAVALHRLPSSPTPGVIAGVGRQQQLAPAAARPRPSLSTGLRRTYASEAAETTHGPPKDTLLAAASGTDEPSAPPREDFGGDEPLHVEQPLEPPLEAQLYCSSIFPIAFGRSDFRPFLASIRRDDLLDQFPLIASKVPASTTHDFSLVRVEKQAKDGGVFVTFRYRPLADELGGREKALREVKAAFEKAALEAGGIKTWSWMGKAKVWRVMGRPFLEDLHRFPSSQVRVVFEGPGLNQEALYDILRPFGRLNSMAPPTPVPAGSSRSSLVQFSSLSSSAAAVSCLHGLSVPPLPPTVITISASGSSVPSARSGPSSAAAVSPTLTRISFTYESPLRAHVIRDWISSHQKLSLPILFFLIGSLSYTLFDPIREFMVSSKLLDRFNIEHYSLFKALKAAAASTLPSIFGATSDGSAPGEASSPVSLEETASGSWHERQEAERMTEGWLKEFPSGFIVVSGPAGSGKTALVKKVVETDKKRLLVIDCAAIAKAKTEAGMISELAKQTGYWPVFGFMASASSLIDLASVGLIGQKAGFSSDFTTQLKAVLDVVSSGLKRASEHELAKIGRVVKNAADRAQLEAEKVVFEERLRRVGYHDGRLGCIAGNGIMSELGYGDEPMSENDLADPSDAIYLSATNPISSDASGAPASDQGAAYLDEERDGIEALPVVVLKNFTAKGSRPELWSTLAEWAAGLIENKVAQVVVVSDNGTNASKPLAKALPSRPINAVSCADADADTALQFVVDKLGSAHAPVTPEEKSLVSLLGGRMSDLEQLVFKVRTGLTVRDAVDDILARTTIELRKSIFGDDAMEAQTLPWTRSQAWVIVQALAAKGELSYANLLMNYPFKGHEDQLKNFEAAEHISVSFVAGRPSMIKPGKPLLREAFRKLVDDPVFKASQSISLNAEIISTSEATIKACEAELLSLKDIGLELGKGVSVFGSASPIDLRARSLLAKLRAAQLKIDAMEDDNAALKAVLGKHV